MVISNKYIFSSSVLKCTYNKGNYKCGITAFTYVKKLDVITLMSHMYTYTWLMGVWHFMMCFLYCILVVFCSQVSHYKKNLDFNDASWLNKAIFSFPGTAMNTCPAHHMSTGQPGRHGNAVPYLVAEASSLDAEPVRTATTVLGVVRYVTRNKSSHMYYISICPPLLSFHCLS